MLSIIIVSYNSDEYLRDCLDSIFFNNDIGEKLEVIIVDNAKSHNTKCIVDKYNQAVYIESSNAGFGAGNNTGARHAKNEYMLFLNPDTVLIEPIFGFAVNQFQSSSQLRAFGMFLVDENGHYQETFGFFPEKIKLIPEKFYLPLIKLGYAPSNIFPWGANLFVRKNDFINAGMFDENIFMCYEEPDLVHRLPEGSVKIFPKRIIHRAGHSNENLKNRYESALRSEEYYFTKYKFDYERYVKNHLLKIKIVMFIKSLLLKNKEKEKILCELYEGKLFEWHL